MERYGKSLFDLVIYVSFIVYINHLQNGGSQCRRCDTGVFNARQWSDTDDKFTQL